MSDSASTQAPSDYGQDSGSQTQRSTPSSPTGTAPLNETCSTHVVLPSISAHLSAISRFPPTLASTGHHDPAIEYFQNTGNLGTKWSPLLNVCESVSHLPTMEPKVDFSNGHSPEMHFMPLNPQALSEWHQIPILRYTQAVRRWERRLIICERRKSRLRLQNAVSSNLGEAQKCYSQESRFLNTIHGSKHMQAMRRRKRRVIMNERRAFRLKLMNPGGMTDLGTKYGHRRKARSRQTRSSIAIAVASPEAPLHMSGPPKGTTDTLLVAENASQKLKRSAGDGTRTENTIMPRASPRKTRVAKRMRLDMTFSEYTKKLFCIREKTTPTVRVEEEEKANECHLENIMSASTTSQAKNTEKNGTEKEQDSSKNRESLFLSECKSHKVLCSRVTSQTPLVPIALARRKTRKEHTFRAQIEQLPQSASGTKEKNEVNRKKESQRGSPSHRSLETFLDENAKDKLGGQPTSHEREQALKANTAFDAPSRENVFGTSSMWRTSTGRNKCKFGSAEDPNVCVNNSNPENDTSAELSPNDVVRDAALISGPETNEYASTVRNERISELKKEILDLKWALIRSSASAASTEDATENKPSGEPKVKKEGNPTAKAAMTTQTWNQVVGSDLPWEMRKKLSSSSQTRSQLSLTYLYEHLMGTIESGSVPPCELTLESLRNSIVCTLKTSKRADYANTPIHATVAYAMSKLTYNFVSKLFSLFLKAPSKVDMAWIMVTMQHIITPLLKYSFIELPIIYSDISKCCVQAMSDVGLLLSRDGPVPPHVQVELRVRANELATALLSIEERSILSQVPEKTVIAIGTRNFLFLLQFSGVKQNIC